LTEQIFDILELILLLAVAIATAIPVYFTYVDRYKISIDLERFVEQGQWVIRVRHLNGRELQRCKVLYSETQLKWHDDKTLWEKRFEKGHTFNVSTGIPEGKEDLKAEVRINDGSQTKKRKNSERLDKSRDN
jgi:hypothetical protein